MTIIEVLLFDKNVYIINMTSFEFPQAEKHSPTLTNNIRKWLKNKHSSFRKNNLLSSIWVGKVLLWKLYWRIQSLSTLENTQEN